MEHSEPVRDHPVYRAAIHRDWLHDRPIVLRHSDTKTSFVPREKKGLFDMVVLHPREKEDHGRPTWLRLAGRRLVTVPNAPTPPKGGTLLLQAFYPAEHREQAIPADQIAYGTDDPPPALMLPQGTFRTRVVDADGKALVDGTVTVGER